MKLRSYLSALALGLSTSASVAQIGPQNLRIKEKGKIVFNPHWYMQAQIGASHTAGELSFADLISTAMGVYGGYQFSPVWGIRAGVSGWEAKGGYDNPKTTYSYNFLQGNMDVTLDLTNLFSKYNPKRFFTAYMFLGMGINSAFNNDEAQAAKTEHRLQYLWKDNKTCVVGRGGLGANLRLTKKIYFNLEANANVMSDHYNSKKSGHPDWQFNALAGFTIKFGKPFKSTPPVYYAPEPIHRK